MPSCKKKLSKVRRSRDDGMTTSEILVWYAKEYGLPKTPSRRSYEKRLVIDNLENSEKKGRLISYMGKYFSPEYRKLA